MSKIEFARDRHWSQLSKLIDEYEAMLAKSLDVDRATLKAANKQKMKVSINIASNRLTKLRRETGANFPIGTYTQFLRNHIYPEGKVLLLQLITLFSKYPGIADALSNDEVPIHASVELDCQGKYEDSGGFQYRILEAMLFEDMCSFWNEACVILTTDKLHSKKRNIKRLHSCYRAAVSSTFYMVEAYCNGIANEVMLTRSDELTEKERQLLTGWDAKQDRSRYLTVRDKLLQYPRLFLRALAPPIQENNSAELAYFLSRAKEFRDAIVHANPAHDYKTLGPKKTQTFENLNHAECAKVVDCSISVVDQVVTAIGRRKAAFWLQKRRSDGLFDESVFD